MVGGNPDDPYKVGVEIFEPVSGQSCSFPDFIFPSKDHSQVRIIHFKVNKKLKEDIRNQKLYGKIFFRVNLLFVEVQIMI